MRQHDSAVARWAWRPCGAICALTKAITLNRVLGYQEVEAFNAEPYAHHWFEKRL